MKTVFLATLFGMTKPFSTLAEAQRALAFNIKKNFQAYMYFSDCSVFLRHFQQENYAVALEVYQKSSAEKGLGSYLYAFTITEHTIDATF
jgi:hypothetical protein